MPLIWLWVEGNQSMRLISVWYQSLHTPASGPFSSHSKINIFHLVPFPLRPQYACCCVSQWCLLKPSRKHKFYQLASTMTSFIKCTIPCAMASTFFRLPPVYMKEMFRWTLMFLSSFSALGNSHRAGIPCPWHISSVAANSRVRWCPFSYTHRQHTTHSTCCHPCSSQGLCKAQNLQGDHGERPLAYQ